MWLLLGVALIVLSGILVASFGPAAITAGVIIAFSGAAIVFLALLNRSNPG
jgi:hypothetical protein